MPEIIELAQKGYRFNEEDHVHLLDGKPLHGTTTVLEVLGKHLTYWASGLACAEFGWINPKPYNKPAPDPDLVAQTAKERHEQVKSMSDEEYLALLSKAYKAHRTALDKSAEAGTGLHFQAELYIKSKIAKVQFTPQDPRLQPFITWCNENVKMFLWSEHCHYSRLMWVGGKSDFAYMDMDGKVVLGDIKSAKSVYLAHFLQAGSYSIAIRENGTFNAYGVPLRKPMKIDKFAIFPFGGGFTKPDIRDNVEFFEEGFKQTLAIYKTKQEFEGD